MKAGDEVSLTVEQREAIALALNCSTGVLKMVANFSEKKIDHLLDKLFPSDAELQRREGK